jgi:hypothetical protein
MPTAEKVRKDLHRTREYQRDVKKRVNRLHELGTAIEQQGKILKKIAISAEQNSSKVGKPQLSKLGRLFNELLSTSHRLADQAEDQILWERIQKIRRKMG